LAETKFLQGQFHHVHVRISVEPGFQQLSTNFHVRLVLLIQVVNKLFPR